MSTIREAALDLYTPPFRFENGYVWDSNNNMVADDGSREAVGLIASRIRGWGRVQYMDNLKGRAAALQDEVGLIVVEALNTYWGAKATPAADVQRDAERYRKLRAQHWSASELAVVLNPKRNLRLGAFCPSGDILDEYVDKLPDPQPKRD